MIRILFFFDIANKYGYRIFPCSNVDAILTTTNCIDIFFPPSFLFFFKPYFNYQTLQTEMFIFPLEMYVVSSQVLV